jgi:hypothetical protein
MPAAGPASPRSSARAGERRPALSDSSSTTTSRVGPSGEVPPGRRSVRRRAPARAADVSGSGDSRRPVPSGSWAWGSHFAQSQSAAAPRAARTMAGRSAGPWSVAAWHSSERARPRAARRSPTMPTTPPPASETGTGAPGRTEAAATTSSSSGETPAAVPGAATGGVHGTSPTPARSTRKSSWAGRRSHRLALGRVARRTTSAGSGDAARRRDRSCPAAEARPVRSSASSRANRARSRRSVRRPRRLASTTLTRPMTGVRAANISTWGERITRYRAPARISGATRPSGENGTVAGPSRGGLGRRSSPGPAAAAGRGGRLNGMVPAAVTWLQESVAWGRSSTRAGRTSTSRPPRRTGTPSGSGSGAVTWRSSRQVPLCEPRSATSTAPVGPRVTAAWRRDSVPSSSAASQPAPRPMTVVPGRSGKRRPASSPPVTTSSRPPASRPAGPGGAAPPATRTTAPSWRPASASARSASATRSPMTSDRSPPSPGARAAARSATVADGWLTRTPSSVRSGPSTKTICTAGER